MTEDDTFNTLRRPSVTEMYAILHNHSYSITLNNPVLEQHGWTREEYDKAKSGIDMGIFKEIRRRLNK